MASDLASGMDHDHYDFSPISERLAITLPGGAQLAFSIVLLVEHFELEPPDGSVFGPAIGGFGAMFPAPNLPLLMAREYGHRVGIYRILDILSRHGIRPSVAIDAMAAERYPAIIEACQDAQAEFVAHGISNSRAITSQMSEDEEVAYIAETKNRLSTALGATPKGWMGPDQAESTRTPMLLDAAGFEYVCDWPNDEAPYPMNTPNGLMVVPNMWSLDDAYAFCSKSLPPSRYADWVIEAAETMVGEGGRALTLVLRPWLSGQAARISSLARIASNISDRPDMWLATTGELADHWRAESRT